MTTIRRLLATAAVLPLALLAAAPAGAETPASTTYHGVFTAVVYSGCNQVTPTGPVSGPWNIIQRGATDATVSINIFLNGKHHVSFGGPVLQAQPPVAGATVAVALVTGAGDLTITLTGEKLTYTISPYDFPGGVLQCPGTGCVTYTGELGR